MTSEPRLAHSRTRSAHWSAPVQVPPGSSAALTSGRKPLTSPCPPTIDSAPPDAMIRGPGTIPSRIASRSAKLDMARRAEVAHGGEAGARGQQRVLDADDRRQLVGIDRLAPERRAGIAGQMDVGVDQAGQHGARRACRRRSRRPARSRPARCGDAAVLDDHRRGPARRLRRVDDQPPGLDRVGLGRSRARRSAARRRREWIFVMIDPPRPRP